MSRRLGIYLLLTAPMWAGPDNERIRQSAAKGLALLQNSQKSWYQKHSCDSCHQQYLPAMAVRAARDHGISLNEEIARADAVRAFGIYSDLDKAVQNPAIIDPTLDNAYALTAAHDAGLRPNLATATWARYIALCQMPDGHWKTVDGRPPQAYSAVTATAVALRAIEFYGHANLAADTRSRVERAGKWLASVMPKSTEEQTWQIYGLSWAGAGSAAIARFVTSLKSGQRPDGGWGPLPGRASEAYSTGEVLTVLREAGGVPVTDAIWQRGLEYLLRTQQADGSWHVVSRQHPPAVVSPPYFETGYPYGHDQFVSAMAAAWAVRALASALPVVAKGEPELKEAGMKSSEQWAETALFGTAATLRAALDKGLNPNSATKSGGTTMLMMVQPDVGKTKLLLDRGAKVNLRANTKYSALMVAAMTPGGTAAANLLLDRGAQVSLAKGEGAPIFNANPMMLATFGGNADLLPRLKKAGLDPNARMMLLGLVPQPPVANTIAFDDVASLRVLLDMGVSVDQADDDGFTLLYYAIVTNHLDTARLLLERGAKVNAVDKRGMTPLLYAVAEDFGDPAMTELLLKHGADPKMKNKEGLNAQQLAQKYAHSYLFSSLVAKR